MKKSKKYFAFFLVVAVSLNIMCTRYVDAAIHTNELYTLYEQETREIINIDGVNYTYNCNYSAPHEFSQNQDGEFTHRTIFENSWGGQGAKHL